MKARILFLIGVFIILWPSYNSAAPQDREIYVLDFENKTGEPALNWLEKGLTEMIFQDQLRLPGLKLNPEYTMAEVIAFNEQDQRKQRKNQYVLLGSIYPSSAGGDILIHMNAIHINTWQNHGERSFTARLSDQRELKNRLIRFLGDLFDIDPLTLDFTVRDPHSDEGRIDTDALTSARRELEALTMTLGREPEKETSTRYESETGHHSPGVTVLKFDRTEASVRLDMDRSHIARTQQAFYDLLLNPYLVQINEPSISTLPYRPHRGRIRVEVSYQIHPELFTELTEILPFQHVVSRYKEYAYLTYRADFSDIPFQLQRDIQLGHYRTIPVIQLTDRQGRIVHTFIDGQYLDPREIAPSDNVTLMDDFKQLLVMTSSRTDIQLFLKEIPYMGVYELELPISILENLSEIRVHFLPITDLYKQY